MSSKATAEKVATSKPDLVHSLVQEKSSDDEKHLEHVPSEINLEYNDDEEEPEIHARTYVAVAAMFLLNFVQVVALQGPPAVLTFIGQDLDNSVRQAWIPVSLSLVQAVVSPVLSSASDTFQARKLLLVGPLVLSFIGAAIAPGSTDIYRLIGSQVLIGFGFATVPLAYCIPSEILPRKWRPMVQSAINVGAFLASIVAPLTIGALTKANPHTGWRNFFWIQTALWGATAIGLYFGYMPPKRHTRFDHLSIWEKLGRLDLIGSGLLTIGLTLLLTAISLGGGLFAWTAVEVLAPLIIGFVILVAFGVYEWKFTKTGILHHGLFRGGKVYRQTFIVCLCLICIEAVTVFAYAIFYPLLTTLVYEADPFLQVLRAQPTYIAGGLSTLLYGYASTKMRTIRLPLFVGFFITTGALASMATLQPGDSTRAVIFSGLLGIGIGGPVALIIAGVQFSTPYDLIATATALTTSSRALFLTVFTAIYAAVVNSRLAEYIPSYIAESAISAGIPTTSLGPFIGAIASNNATALSAIPGVTPVIIDAGVTALKQAYADGIRVVYFIAVPISFLACILCYFLGDMKDTMNYHVDAPLEDLHAKKANMALA